MTFSLCNSLVEREGDPCGKKGKAERYGYCGRGEERDWQGEREKRLLISVVLGVCYCFAPLHSRGSRWEKAACLFKGTGGWSQGREWRRKGGRRQLEQQHSSAKSATKQRGGTSEAHARRQEGRIINSSYLLWIILLLRFLLLEIFIPPGVAAFYPQMRSKYIHSP